MTTKPLLSLIVALTFLTSACSPKAPTQIAVATQAPLQRPKATHPPAGTAAPAEPLGVRPTPADMFFQNYGVNAYIDTSEDHLSTFALDVDTASYALARSYVQDGLRPPADAIRVEEFVNYFKQDYANPANVAFGLYADGAPSPFQRDGTHILRFGVQGYNVPEEERQAASLTFVIDVSGSMASENRLGLVKRSLQLLVDRLRPSDTVAIVVYGTQARLILNPTSGEDRATLLNAIYSLTPEGSTNAEAGLKLGYEIANRAYRAGGINRVILCSDGVANVGATGPDQILHSIRGYADAGITLSAFGFGMGNFNDVLLEQLADKGDGNYAYVDDLDEARRLFVENLTATLQVIALNAKTQVDFNPAVVSRYRLIGYENRAVADEQFRDNTVDAGEIGAGHSVTALYAVQLRPEARGRIATVHLRWEDPQTRAVHEISGDFDTESVARSFDDASLRYQLDVVVMQYAEVLRRSPWAQATNLNDLRIRAERLAAQLPRDADVAEFAELVAQVAQMGGD